MRPSFVSGTLVALALCLVFAVMSPVARGDIRDGGEVMLVNGDLDSGLLGWVAQASDPGASFTAHWTPAGRSFVRVTVAAGFEATMEQVLPLGAGGLDSPPSDVWLGQRCAGRATVRRGSGAAGSVRLDLLRRGAGPDSVISTSVEMGSGTPASKWKDLVAEPLGGAAGRVDPQSMELVVRLVISGPGTIDVDRLTLGDHAPVRHLSLNGGFERGSAGWVMAGASRVQTGRTHPSRRGRHHLVLIPGAQASARIRLKNTAGRPWIGEQPVLGMWLRVPVDPNLPLLPDANQCVRLELLVHRVGMGVQVLAQTAFCPDQSDGGIWRWVETPKGAVIPENGTSLRLRIVSQLGVEVSVDEVGVGAAEALDGTAGALRLAAYAPWYRNPIHPDALPSAAGSKERWGNWAWSDPSPCDPTSLSLTHDPDFLRNNGRRDGATSTVDGLDALPLVGLYDSRDRDVALLAVDLARAAGIGGFVVDWHGLELDMVTTPTGEAPRQWQSFLELVEAADRPGVDFELAPMLEPKVQQAGWLDPQATLLQRRQSLLDEVSFLVRTIGHRRCMLRLDGKLVFFVFWHNIPGWDGQRLDEGDWQWICEQVETETQEAVTLIATHPPDGNSQAFGGYGRWHLIDDPLLRFRSFGDFQSGTHSSVSLSTVEGFARGTYSESQRWRNLQAETRRAFGLVWWGFDDSGVAGWSSTHGLGSDGQALCVRVSPQPNGGFLGATRGVIEAGGHSLVVSWNDWNERTALEPAWNEAYWSQLQTGQPVLAADRQASLAGLLSLSAQGGSAPQVLDGILRRYVRKVASGAAVAYD